MITENVTDKEIIDLLNAKSEEMEEILNLFDGEVKSQRMQEWAEEAKDLLEYLKKLKDSKISEDYYNTLKDMYINAKNWDKVEFDPLDF